MNKTNKPHPAKETVKAVMDECDELDLSDSAYWHMVHDKLGLEYGDVFHMLQDDPDYFGVEYPEKKDK